MLCWEAPIKYAPNRTFKCRRSDRTSPVEPAPNRTFKCRRSDRTSPNELALNRTFKCRRSDRTSPNELAPNRTFKCRRSDRTSPVEPAPVQEVQASASSIVRKKSSIYQRASKSANWICGEEDRGHRFKLCSRKESSMFKMLFMMVSQKLCVESRKAVFWKIFVVWYATRALFKKPFSFKNALKPL